MSTINADNCGQESKEICASASSWYKAKRANLRLEEDDGAKYADWLFTIPNQQNLSIKIDQKYPNANMQGDIMLVSGRLMITKGLDLKPGYEIDAIDGPILMYQLAISLLDQAFPKGPSSVVNEHKINKHEKDRSIRIATMSASGQFAPPWSISGNVKRENDEMVTYDLIFTFTTGDKERTWKLSGFWENPKITPGFDEVMKIEGWEIHSLGPVVIKNEGGTILDYGANKKVLDIKTLGQLRQYVQAQEKSSNKSLKNGTREELRAP
jgi:hypothetical protein